jgi:hypothetical protein
MKIIKLAKHILPNRTFKCGHCNGNLDVIDVTNNPKHFFNPGQLFSCFCQKSQIWANSIRNPKELVEYCDGGSKDVEAFGFCNDAFCPKCWQNAYPLRTPGFVYNGRSYYYKDAYGETGLISMLSEEEIKNKLDSGEIIYGDIWGCEKCEDNQLLIHQGVVRLI